MKRTIKRSFELSLQQSVCCPFLHPVCVYCNILPMTLPRSIANPISMAECICDIATIQAANLFAHLLSNVSCPFLRRRRKYVVRLNWGLPINMERPTLTYRYGSKKGRRDGLLFHPLRGERFHLHSHASEHSSRWLSIFWRHKNAPPFPAFFSVFRCFRHSFSRRPKVMWPVVNAIEGKSVCNKNIIVC